MKEVNEARYYSKGCKTLSQLKDRIIRAYTHGDAFRWLGLKDEDAKIQESRKKAEAKADAIIKENMHILSHLKNDL